jgi:hypothetical protein
LDTKISLTKHWREIFDPAAQIFLNLNVRLRKELTLTDKEKLEYLKNNENLLHIIHYSCENLNDNNEGYSPRITSIAIVHIASDTTHSFSIHLIAEQMEIERSKIAERYNELEKVMLNDFNEFIKNHQDALWIHWNMNNINYGFEALDHRYKVLTKNNASKVIDTKKFNLSKMILGIYGSDCVDHPRMPNLMELNGGHHRDYLSGKDEVNAFKNQEYVKLHNSTIGKAKWFEIMYKKLQNRKINTTRSNWKHKLNSFLEHPIVKLIGFIAVLFSIYQLVILLTIEKPNKSLEKEQVTHEISKPKKAQK